MTQSYEVSRHFTFQVFEPVSKEHIKHWMANCWRLNTFTGTCDRTAYDPFIYIYGTYICICIYIYTYIHKHTHNHTYIWISICMSPGYGHDVTRSYTCVTWLILAKLLVILVSCVPGRRYYTYHMCKKMNGEYKRNTYIRRLNTYHIWHHTYHMIKILNSEYDRNTAVYDWVILHTGTRICLFTPWRMNGSCKTYPAVNGELYQWLHLCTCKCDMKGKPMLNTRGEKLQEQILKIK